MTQDDTKDPVRVLIETVRSISNHPMLPSDVIDACRIALALTESAAIPHSEQRGAVPDELPPPSRRPHLQYDYGYVAGWNNYRKVLLASTAPVAAPVPEAKDWQRIAQMLNELDRMLAKHRLTDGHPTRQFLSSILFAVCGTPDAPVPEAKADFAHYDGLSEATKMAAKDTKDTLRALRAMRPSAPLPEAKAERVGAKLHREDIASRLQGALNAAPGSNSAEVSKLTLREAIEELAAPAVSPSLHSVKHEASELPPLATWSYSEIVDTMVPDSPRGANRQRYYRVEDVDALLARQSAPPIAVQGSEDDAAPTKAMLLEAIDDKVARSEDLMSDFPPHRAMERWNEASATLKDIVNRLFDSRSPAAAAPTTEKK